MSASLIAAGLGGGFLTGWPGLLGPGRNQLLNAANQLLHPALTLARASAAWGFVNNALTGFGSNVPRWVDGPALLMESGRSNLLRNPRLEGFTAGALGAGGAAPTFFQIGGIPTGITGTIGSATDETGVSRMTLRLNGTNTSGGAAFPYMLPEASNTAVGCVQGVTHAASWYIRVHAGSVGSLTSTLRMAEYTSGGASLSGAYTDQSLALTSADLSAARFSCVRAANQATCGAMSLALLMVIPDAATIDVTLMFGHVQQEAGFMPSSPILPVSGTPGVSTRATDSLSADFSQLFPGGAGTILLRGSLNAIQAGVNQSVVQIDDGTGNNRLMLRQEIGAPNLYFWSLNGGSGGNVSAGAMTSGAIFRAGFTFDGTGNAFASLNGAAAVSRSGVATGFSKARIAGGAGLTDAASGLFSSALSLPYGVSGSQLPAMVAAL